MRRLVSFALALIFCLCALASCAVGYNENEWYSSEHLDDCLVPALPRPSDSFLSSGKEDIYLSLTDTEYRAYAKAVHEYLASCDFTYLGTRGTEKSSLAGAFTTYYFEPADYLSRFEDGDDYIFVFSDDLKKDGNVVFTVLTISRYETETIKYSGKSFDYNTIISLRRGSEKPLGGMYVLPGEGDHEHIYGEWQYGDDYHWRSVRCTWDMCDIDTTAEHYDTDQDLICDACGYEMKEHEHIIVWGYDEFSHSYSYECGCITPPNAAQHTDADEDGKCDGCEYYFDGPIPNPKTYKLSELIPWLAEVGVDDISKLRMTLKPIGVGPGSTKDIYTTEDAKVITDFIGSLCEVAVEEISEHDAMIDGGIAYIIDIKMNDGEEKQFRFSNRMYRIGNTYYRLKTLPSLRGYDSVEEYMTYITYNSRFELYTNEDEPSLISTHIGMLGLMEFCEVDEPGTEVADRYIDADVGQLYILSDTEFYILDYYGERIDYQIVGDVTFADLDSYLYSSFDEPTGSPTPDASFE